MTTLDDRPHTALLVIDVQNDVVADTYDRGAVVDRIALLVERVRDADVEVVWVQHHDADLPRDSQGWQLVAELVPNETEPVVHKSYGDAFEETDLEPVLAERGVGRLLVAGAQTDDCIRSTLHGAITRGYDTILVADAHTTEDSTAYGAPPPDKVITHTNLYWQYHEAPGRTAGVVTADDVDLSSLATPAPE